MNTKTPRVLIVEDDAAIRGILETFLRADGLEVVSFGDSRAAMEGMRGREPFQLVVSDVKLPGLSGPELVRELRRQNSALKALYVTGAAPERFTNLPAGGSEDLILEKPFRRSTLIEKVRLLLPIQAPLSEDSSGGAILKDRGTYLEASFQGEYTKAGFMEQIAAAVQSCRRLQRRLLLINTTGMRGAPSAAERLDIGSRGGLLAQGLKVALVATPEQADPRKPGIEVARSGGLDVDLFLDRAEALSWLLV